VTTNLPEDVQAAQAQYLDNLKAGMIFTAKKLKQYYDILAATDLPEAVIMAEITAWCQGESRLQVESMLHRNYVQQHQEHEAQNKIQQETTNVGH
jgi:hypothetical protein